MPFTAWCNIDGCSFEERQVPDLEAVFDLQDEHRERLGDSHVLEFERILGAAGADVEADANDD